MKASAAWRGSSVRAGAGGRGRQRIQLSDDYRGIIAWSEQRAGETRVYLDRSDTGVHFGAPQLLESFRDPDGVSSPAASPTLVRLSSESVMMAWAGAAAGHRVVRTAAIDLLGVGTPSTISAPAGDALLADLTPGPDGDALVLWSEPQTEPDGAPDLGEQAIYAARGIDAYPRQTLFDAPEELAGPGPNSDATVAIDPADDHALAVWLGAGGQLQYSVGAAPAHG